MVDFFKNKHTVIFGLLSAEARSIVCVACFTLHCRLMHMSGVCEFVAPCVHISGQRCINRPQMLPNDSYFY